MTSRAYKFRILMVVIAPLLGVVVAIFMLWNRAVFLEDVLLLIGLHILFTLGIGVGFHRLLTHDGFKSHPAVRYLFVILGCMAVEGQPLAWTATHIKHHAHSDEEGDPHSPLHGFWHGHVGWLFEENNFEKAEDYCPHLLEDKTLVRIDKMYWVWVVLTLGIPAAIAGWSGFIWGGLVRIFVTTHVTWSVNSICHTFGKREFETTDESRNNWIIGLLALGEGWHNNHHAFPKNAFHGMRWYQFDLNGIVIRAMERVGLVWQVQRVGQEVLDAHHIRGKSMHENITLLKAELGEFIDISRDEMNQMMMKLPPQQVAAMRFAHEQSMKRFAEIQLSLAKRRNMKKAAIERRRKEVAMLLATARQRMELATA